MFAVCIGTAYTPAKSTAYCIIAYLPGPSAKSGFCIVSVSKNNLDSLVYAGQRLIYVLLCSLVLS